MNFHSQFELVWTRLVLPVAPPFPVSRLPHRFTCCKKAQLRRHLPKHLTAGPQQTNTWKEHQVSGVYSSNRGAKHYKNISKHWIKWIWVRGTVRVQFSWLHLLLKVWTLHWLDCKNVFVLTQLSSWKILFFQFFVLVLISNWLFCSLYNSHCIDSQF